MILKKLPIGSRGGESLICSCDCGCGKWIRKTKHQYENQKNHFFNMEHYLNWKRKIAKETWVECSCGCGKKMYRYKSGISRYNFFNSQHLADWKRGRNRFGVIPVMNSGEAVPIFDGKGFVGTRWHKNAKIKYETPQQKEKQTPITYYTYNYYSYDS